MCTGTLTHIHTHIHKFFLEPFVGKSHFTPKYFRVFFPLKSKMFYYQKAFLIIKTRKLTLQQYFYLISFYSVFFSVLIMHLLQRNITNHCCIQLSFIPLWPVLIWSSCSVFVFHDAVVEELFCRMPPQFAFELCS